MVSNKSQIRINEQLCYLSESLFIKTLEEKLLECFRKTNCYCSLHREIVAGKSIADIVIVRVPVCSAHENGFVLSAKESAILAYLRNNGSTAIDILELNCGLQPKELNSKLLERLITNGMISQKENILSFASKWMSKVHIVAFEVKLTKWKAALHQAINYKRYADSVYVIMPDLNAGPAIDNIEQFRFENVGLLTANNDNIDFEYKPKEIRKHDWRREYVLSRIIAASSA